jgi:hypothetical protein
VVRMAKENPGWGYDRIVGAMANLGLRLSDQTVGNILRRHDIPPAPKRKQATSWKDFIRAHMAVLQFRVTACIRFTPPLRRSPSAPSSGTQRACPRRTIRSWFRRHLNFLTTRFRGFTFVRLSDAHLHELLSRFYSNAHHHSLLPQQLGVV